MGGKLIKVGSLCTKTSKKLGTNVVYPGEQTDKQTHNLNGKNPIIEKLACRQLVLFFVEGKTVT